LSPILFPVYLDRLVKQLRRQGLCCSLFNEFCSCLYADDIPLITHTVHAMQKMLHLCDKFANDFDTKFNCEKSVAMRIGKWFNEQEIRYMERVSVQYCFHSIPYTDRPRYSFL